MRLPLLDEGDGHREGSFRVTNLEDASPTELLRNDHRVIEQVLGELEAASERIRRGEKVPVETITKAVVFSQSFVDACHHGKEEACLFPCLEKKGIPREGGPIGMMLYEHQVGREYVMKIQDALARHVDAEAEGAELSKLCSEYVAHIRQHIFKEENVLFRLGDQVMRTKDMAETSECFERTEEEKLGKGKHEEMLKLAEELVRRP